MAYTSIQKIINKDYAGIFQWLLDSMDCSIAILDQGGNVVIHSRVNGNQPLRDAPFYQGDTLAGWVRGSGKSDQVNGVASLLTYILNQEAEKKDLAAEVLDRYRELNLLYRLSSRLVTSPKPEEIAQIALEEICPLIHAAHGAVLLKSEASGQLEMLASCGYRYNPHQHTLGPEVIIERVMQTGVPEMSSAQPAPDQFPAMPNSSVSVMCAPLKTEKEIIGVIIMVGEHPDDFAAGDLKLLTTIASQTAPAIEIAHLYQASIEKARLEHDLEMARKVQADLLPRNMPQIEGWQISAYWNPARMVSGDFYDFIPLPDGRLGLVIGDVTGKGMPAALVMANTRSILRGVAGSSSSNRRDTPARMLGRANNLLCDDMPQHMFVTCLLIFLDYKTGRLTFANAGHPLPFHKGEHEVTELCATGMPLGIFPRYRYEDNETQMNPGESLVLYSDGLIEAHNNTGDMYGIGRIRTFMDSFHENHFPRGEKLIHSITEGLEEFTGPGWEQEDDVTLVVLERTAG